MRAREERRGDIAGFWVIYVSIGTVKNFRRRKIEMLWLPEKFKVQWLRCGVKTKSGGCPVVIRRKSSSQSSTMSFPRRNVGLSLRAKQDSDADVTGDGIVNWINLGRRDPRGKV